MNSFLTFDSMKLNRNEMNKNGQQELKKKAVHAHEFHFIK